MTKTYANTGTYSITLSLTGAATRRTFAAANNPLVPRTLTTANDVYVNHMPAMSRFGTSATGAGNNFFRAFNYSGAITSLPT